MNKELLLIELEHLQSIATRAKESITIIENRLNKLIQENKPIKKVFDNDQ